jgi:tetratricopeptide (TPR) repeat protein
MLKTCMRDQVFISYSHRDSSWLERLQVYLAPIERRGGIRRWDDTLIAPGHRWEREIEAALKRTRVAILLVSAEFLASDFISRVELPRLLGAAENQGVLIIPVVLDHCNFERCTELAQFQSINSPTQPLEILGEPERKAMLAKLAAAVEDALGERATDQPAATPAKLVGLPARNPLFCGRTSLLEALSTALQRSGRAALCGLPGLGKTETAIEFAQRRRQTYEWVLWSRADSEQQVVRGFCAFAAALGLPEASGADQLAAARAALTALSMRGKWLLILDSVEDLNLVRSWLPSGEGGHVLLTLRSAAVGGLSEPLELEPLELDEAVEFLLRRARLTESAVGEDASLIVAAREVAQAATGFPLALDQAGAYVEETGCSLQDYAALWREHSRQLLAERGQGSLRQDDSLIQAWSLSLDQLKCASPAAAALLCLFAFCHYDALPEAALSHAIGLVEPELATTLANPMTRNAILRAAQSFAFLRRDAKSRRLTMHRLVQQFIRDGMTKELQREWGTYALKLIDSAFPRPRFVNWRDCDALAGHALCVLDYATASGVEPSATARLSCELGCYFMQRARYAEAEPHIARALTLRRATPANVTDLARVLTVEGQFQLLRGGLAAAEARLNEAAVLLAAQPPGVALVSIFDLLGLVELARNNFDAAEDWLAKAQATAMAASAQHTAEAAQCINDRGIVRFRRGDYPGARASFEQAAGLRREILPPGHPSIAQSLNNLAAVCARLGERAAARTSYCEALSLRETALGAQHPDVAESLFNLALLDFKDGELVTARAALTRAAAIQLACRGILHPELAKVQACLAEIALVEGKLDESQRLYSEAHEARLRMFGADHPDTARALLGLADVSRVRGERGAAAAAMEQALSVLQRHLGSNHHDVKACEEDLRRMREEPKATEEFTHPTERDLTHHSST